MSYAHAGGHGRWNRIRNLCIAVLCALGAPPPAHAADATASQGPYRGQIITVAGIGEQGYSGDGQPATAARIAKDADIDVAEDGTLYLVDGGSRRVRAVGKDGVIRTVPGTRALRSPHKDGPEVDGFQYSPSDVPRGVAAGPDGALYVAGDETIRRIDAHGHAKLLAKVDYEKLDRPREIDADRDGNVYVLTENGKIVKIDRHRKMRTIAGGGHLDPADADADGKRATKISVSDDAGFTVTPNGAVYLIPGGAYSDNAGALLRVDPDGTATTLVDGKSPGYSGDHGPVDKAKFGKQLWGVASDRDGNVYVGDGANGVIREIDSKGVVTSLPTPLSPSESTADLAVGPQGDVYMSDGAEIEELVRHGAAEPAQPSRAPDYPDRLHDDPPGAIRNVAGTGRQPAEPPSPAVSTADQEAPPKHVATGPHGSTYYSDPVQNQIMAVSADGKISVFAGRGGTPGFGGDGGQARKAKLSDPEGIDVAPDGTVYFADKGNRRVRKVDRRGVITTVAGNGKAGDHGGYFGEKITTHGDKGPATKATVTPIDVAVGKRGDLYIAEDENSRVSKVDKGGKISAVAGGGQLWKEKADGHPATDSQLFEPDAVTVGPGGEVYVLESCVGTNCPDVRMIDAKGIMHTVVGDSYREEEGSGFSGDGGPAKKAELNNPHDVATGPDGTLYVADTYNARIRAVSKNGTITTIAGTGERADSGDGGSARKAAVNEPESIDVDDTGRLRTVGLPGDRLRAIAGGTISTAAKLPAGSAGPQVTEATLDVRQTENLAVDNVGNLLVQNGDDTFAVDRRGIVSRPFAHVAGLTGRTATGIAVGPDGQRYVSTADAVYRLLDDGRPMLVAGGRQSFDPSDGTPHAQPVDQKQPATLAAFAGIHSIAVSPKGTLYISSSADASSTSESQTVYRLTRENTLQTMYTAKGQQGGIAADGDDRLYVAEPDDNRVVRVDAPGEQTTVAGNGDDNTADNHDGDKATDHAVEAPQSVAVDNSGNLYIGNYDGILRVDDDGDITTVAKNQADADGSTSAFDALTLDRHQNLYYVDSGHYRIRALARPADIDTPTDWWGVVWWTAGAIVVLVAGFLGYRYLRKRRAKAV